MATRKNEAKWIESRSRWQINVQSNGVRRTFASNTAGRKGKIECERKADEWLDSNLISETTRAEKVLDEWIAKLRRTGSKSLWMKYEGFSENWIKPIFGHKKIGKVSHKDLQEVIDNYYINGNNGKGASKKTLQNMRGCLSSFMKYCRSIPCSTIVPEFVTIPKSAAKKEKQIATHNDLRILFSSDKTTWYGKTQFDFYINAYRFMVVTGLRPGELIGLEQCDIKGNTLKVSRSINDLKEQTRGKNDNAKRTIHLPQLALKILEDQKEMLKSHGLISKYVFPRPDGNCIQQKKFRTSWQRYRQHNGITGASTPYEMRHTFVSITDDMPLALKKLVVGHSENMDTEGIYGHQKSGDLDRAASYIDCAFDKVFQEEE